MVPSEPARNRCSFLYHFCLGFLLPPRMGRQTLFTPILLSASLLGVEPNPASVATAQGTLPVRSTWLLTAGSRSSVSAGLPLYSSYAVMILSSVSVKHSLRPNSTGLFNFPFLIGLASGSKILTIRLGIWRFPFKTSSV